MSLLARYRLRYMLWTVGLALLAVGVNAQVIPPEEGPKTGEPIVDMLLYLLKTSPITALAVVMYMSYREDRKERIGRESALTKAFEARETKLQEELTSARQEAERLARMDIRVIQELAAALNKAIEDSKEGKPLNFSHSQPIRIRAHDTEVLKP